MKKRFFFIALLICLLAGKNINAQQTRFIELTVSDTVVLKYTQVVYQIGIGKQQNEYMGMKFGGDEEQASEDALPTLKDVTSLLDKKKFKYTVILNKDYSVNDKESKPTVEVTVKSEVELVNLYEFVKNQKGLNGSIKEVIYEDQSKYQEALFKRLYSKAKQQVGLMAAAAGCKVGSLISISDSNSGTFDIMTMYKQMMKTMPKNIFGETSSLESKEAIEMVFKFAIE